MRHRFLLATLGFGLLLAGCATPPVAAPLAKVAAPTRLEIVNLTSYPWSIEIVAVPAETGLANPSPSFRQTARVEPRATLVVELPVRDYQVTQIALAGITGADASQRFPLRVAAGERLHWRLATLLDNADAPPTP